jgi:hypothetical protein
MAAHTMSPNNLFKQLNTLEEKILNHFAIYGVESIIATSLENEEKSEKDIIDLIKNIQNTST